MGFLNRKQSSLYPRIGLCGIHLMGERGRGPPPPAEGGRVGPGPGGGRGPRGREEGGRGLRGREGAWTPYPGDEGGGGPKTRILDPPTPSGDPQKGVFFGPPGGVKKRQKKGNFSPYTRYLLFSFWPFLTKICL